jgi:hypothetical protein
MRNSVSCEILLVRFVVLTSYISNFELDKYLGIFEDAKKEEKLLSRWLVAVLSGLLALVARTPTNKGLEEPSKFFPTCALFSQCERKFTFKTQIILTQ